MTNGTDSADEKTQAGDHLSAALDTDEPDEKNYHIRQALQLLGIEDTTD